MRRDEILAWVRAERLGLRGMRLGAADCDWSAGEGPGWASSGLGVCGDRAC
ncbi:hypothetical protein HNR40_010660 [Nonomuraea endophytica]|uniref:Uncharacterized protein n=1 Tax=Nonomuraea endophytica TaxID=714136 RepID=A0A7W8AHE2_9ACTN|nr:hypothetical protein [Nonomuraea endophytica]